MGEQAPEPTGAASIEIAHKPHQRRFDRTGALGSLMLIASGACVIYGHEGQNPFIFGAGLAGLTAGSFMVNCQMSLSQLTHSFQHAAHNCLELLRR